MADKMSSKRVQFIFTMTEDNSKYSLKLNGYEINIFKSLNICLNYAQRKFILISQQFYLPPSKSSKSHF